MRADLPRRGGPSAEGPRPRGAPAWPAIGFMAGSKPPLSPWAGWGPQPPTLAALRERKDCAPRSLGFKRRFPTPYPGGSGSPDSAANSGRAGLTPPSLELRPRERQSYPGACGGRDSAANRAAGRADTPRWMAVAPHGGPGGSPVNLWPLSFDQESGDTGVGLLPDSVSNLSFSHGTI